MAGDEFGTVLIIGAAGAIGEETAYAFAENGVTAIAFADIDEAKVKAIAEKSKSFAVNPAYRAEAFWVDVTDADGVQNLVDVVMQKFGRIDSNINAVGIDNDIYLPIFDSAVEEYEKVMDVNAKGLMLCNRAVSKAMLGQAPGFVTTRRGRRDIGRGSIVNLASVVSHITQPGKTAYVTSKHAVMGITKTAALDCASHGIRVNACCPSWVSTPAIERDRKQNPDLDRAVRSLIPCGRPAELEEITGVILFLCGPSASYMTGTSLVIDAGLTLTVHLG